MRVAVALWSLFACSGSGAGKPSGPGPTPVRVEVVVPAAIERAVEAAGTVRSLESAELRAEVAGLVEAVVFTEGQAVAKGDVLVRLRTADAEAAVIEAEARVRMADEDLGRARALFEKGDLSRAELDRAEAAEGLARSAALRAAEGLRRCTLRAPFAGRVGRRAVSPGELVEAGRVLTSLEGLGELRVDVHFPEAELGRLALGVPAAITAPALPDAIFPGAVAYLGAAVDEATRTVDVRLSVEDPAGLLRPGMSAEARLVVGETQGALLVPSEAVSPTAEGATVWVVADGKVARRGVTLGDRHAARVEVVAGLAAGEAVVVEGLARLREGAPVEVKASP